MTKTLKQNTFFFLHQNQNIFFSNIGNQNIFLEKKHTYICITTNVMSSNLAQVILHYVIKFGK
jgi:hypothetical protein